MNSQLESARHSSILNVAAEKSTKALVYAAEKALKFPGILSRQTVEMNCTNEFLDCVAQPSERTISLPKFGFLSSIVLELNVEGLGPLVNVQKNRGFTAPRGPGFMPGQEFGNMYELFDEFELRTQSGKSISLMKSATIQNLLASDSRYASERLLASSHSLESKMDPLTIRVLNDDQSLALIEGDRVMRKAFIAIPFKMFDMFSTCPDLLTLEQIQLVVRGGPQTRVQKRSDFIEGMNLKLHLAYHLPTPERHEELVKMQHVNGSAFNYISTSYKHEPVKRMHLTSGKRALAWTGELLAMNTGESAEELAAFMLKNPYFEGLSKTKNTKTALLINTAHDKYQITQVLQPLEMDITTAQPVTRTFVHIAHPQTGRRGVITGLKVTDAGNTLYEVSGRKLLSFLGRSKEAAMSDSGAAGANLIYRHGSSTGADKTAIQFSNQYSSTVDPQSDGDQAFGCAVIDWGLLNCFKDEQMVGSAVSFHQMSAPRIEISAVFPPIQVNYNAVPDFLGNNQYMVSTDASMERANTQFGTYFGKKTKAVISKLHVKSMTNVDTPVASVVIAPTAFNTTIDAVTDLNGSTPFGQNTKHYVKGEELDLGLYVAHEVMEVTTIQPSASGRNRQIRVIGTR